MAAKRKSKKTAGKKAASRRAASDREAVFRALADAVEMTSDAIAVAEKGLNANPTREQRRALNEEILELNAKLTKLQGKLLATARGTATVARPTDPQIARLKRLSADVDGMVNRSVSASRAVTTVGKVLDLLQESQLV